MKRSARLVLRRTALALIFLDWRLARLRTVVRLVTVDAGIQNGSDATRPGSLS